MARLRFKFSESFTIDSAVDPWRVEGFRCGFFGAPGSGKSYCAAVAVEQFLDQGGTVVIFQPRAEWHTLKEKYPVQVVGGPFNQDVPFVASEPRLYADAVVNQGISMVFYTGDVEDEAELVDFASNFIRHLLRLEESVKRPILLVLEEAQEYAPRSSQGHVAPPWVYNRMIKQFKDCFTQGRKLNVSPVAISQRPQEVNFTIRQLCNLTLYGKFAPQDIAYIDKECLKPYRDKGMSVKAGQLLDLAPGRWLVIGGSEAQTIAFNVKRKTQHGADTPTLEYVASASEAVQKTISDLGLRLQEMIDRRRAEESELEKSKRRIREQEKEIAELREKSNIAGMLREGFEKGLGKDQVKAFVEPSPVTVQALIDEAVAPLRAELDAEKKIAAELEGRIKGAMDALMPMKVSTDFNPDFIPRGINSSPLSSVARNLPSYDRKIYEYLSDHSGVSFNRYQISTALGLGSKSSRYVVALRRLKSLKLVEETSEGLKA